MTKVNNLLLVLILSFCSCVDNAMPLGIPSCSSIEAEMEKSEQKLRELENTDISKFNEKAKKEHNDKYTAEYSLGRRLATTYRKYCTVLR